MLEASINGSPLFPLILDSGADSMVLPLNLFMALAQHGYLTRDSDQYLGDVQLGLAGGSATSGAVIRIRSLTLGNITVHDVICTIMKSGQPLLGQSVLSKFHSVTINNDANTLDISEREAS